MIILNPTGLGIRNDSAGHGDFGTSRGHRLHKGTDFECVPGQEIICPISGTFVRASYPYSADLSYLGAMFRCSGITIKMWYFKPLPSLLPGQELVAGAPIGYAQDISKKYDGGMIPHIHMQGSVNAIGQDRTKIIQVCIDLIPWVTL